MRERKFENPFSLRLTPEKKELVEKQAEIEGIKAVDWIRKAIEEKLARDGAICEPRRECGNDRCLERLALMLRDPSIRAIIREIVESDE